MPLEFGIAYHEGMAAMYKPETWGAPRVLIAQFAEAAFYDNCQRQKRDYHRLIDRGMSDEEERDYEKLVSLGRGMIQWYVQNHLPLEEFVPVYVEQSFQVPITYPDGTPLMCKCPKCWAKQCAAWKTTPEAEQEWNEDTYKAWAGLPVVYEGRVDAIVRDKNGDYWILDWKTTIRMLKPDDQDVILELDDQITGYVYALRRRLGLNIRGFRYIELKKGFPEPPPENKVVRLGRSFSVSKNLDTDVDTYTRTVRTRDAVAYREGLYDEFIEWLRLEGPRFINDHKVYKRHQQLVAFEQHLLWQALEIINPDLPIYPSPGRFSCGFCAFKEPCLDKDSGGDYEYALETMFEVKPRYYMLREMTTDKKGIG